MGRNRVPSNILHLRGSYKVHPERMRDAEPQAAPFKPSPPRHFGPNQKRCWRELVKYLPPGTLQQSDRISLEIAAVLIEEMRRFHEVFPSSRYQTLMTVLSKLGMSPADRSKIEVPQKCTNKFDRFNRTN